jgi:hypothetical protein
MPGTTTKMGIQYPTGTDYVKDGASAMQTLATNVDNKSGLVFIKSQTVGSGVTSVTVNAAFSTNFDNYRIIYMGGSASTFSDLWLRLGATTTGYYMGGSFTAYNAGAVTAVSTGLAAQWTYSGIGDPAGNALSVDVFQPYLADQSGIASSFFSLGNTRVGGAVYGVLNNTTSYTAFTIVVSAGTITGGTIRVYGYNQ